MGKAEEEEEEEEEAEAEAEAEARGGDACATQGQEGGWGGSAFRQTLPIIFATLSPTDERPRRSALPHGKPRVPLAVRQEFPCL